VFGVVGSALRSFRTTIIAGTLWVAALFLALYPYVDDAGPGLQDLGASLAAIRSAAPDVMPVVALVFAAYVLGVISEAIFGSAARLFSKHLIHWQAGVQAALFQDAVTRARPSNLNDIGTLSAFLETAQGRASALFSYERDPVRAALLETRSTAPGVAREVDVLREEASFRLQLLAPLVGLAVAFCLHAPTAWIIAVVILGIVAFAAIAASANHAAERANDALADWVTSGRPAVPGDGGQTANEA
jgi:hypothetical protein